MDPAKREQSPLWIGPHLRNICVHLWLRILTPLRNTSDVNPLFLKFELFQSGVPLLLRHLLRLAAAIAVISYNKFARNQLTELPPPSPWRNTILPPGAGRARIPVVRRQRETSTALSSGRKFSELTANL